MTKITSAFIPIAEAETLVSIVNQNTPIKELSKLLSKAPLRAVLFEEGGYFKGLITQGDLLRYFALNNHNINETLKKDLVVSDLKVTRPQKVAISIAHAKQIIQDYDVNLVPIIDKEERCYGLFIQGFKDSILEARKLSFQTYGLILAGGIGERMKPLTNNTPKPLLRLGSGHIIDHVLESMRACNCNSITVSTHFKHKKIEEFFTKEDDIKIQIETKKLGTGGPFVDWVKNSNLYLADESNTDTLPIVVVSNGDLLCSFSHEDIIAFHNSSSDFQLFSVSNTIKLGSGVIQKSGQGFVSKIDEKPEIHIEKNAGIYLIKLSKPLIKFINNFENSYIDMPDLINELIKDGNFQITSKDYIQNWYDLGTKNDFYKVGELLK